MYGRHKNRNINDRKTFESGNLMTGSGLNPTRSQDHKKSPLTFTHKKLDGSQVHPLVVGGGPRRDVDADGSVRLMPGKQK
jgi:hypothetical protein